MEVKDYRGYVALLCVLISHICVNDGLGVKDWEGVGETRYVGASHTFVSLMDMPLLCTSTL